MRAEVRRIVPDDWPALRALRLEALEDTPIAFLETLEAARALGDEAWRARAARGAVGIWHETYLVEAGRYEAVYGNMPRFGLAKAAGHVVARRGLETARRRLGGDSEPAVETTY